MSCSSGARALQHCWPPGHRRPPMSPGPGHGVRPRAAARERWESSAGSGHKGCVTGAAGQSRAFHVCERPLGKDKKKEQPRVPCWFW